MGIQREMVFYLQDLDELVWTPEVNEVKFACVCLPKEISQRQMIPLGGITAGGNIGVINNSVFGRAEAERDGRLGKPQTVTCFTFTNAVCFPVSNFTASP